MHHGKEIDQELKERLGLGATGKFPHGQIDPTDEGEIKIAIAADPAHQVVRIEFGKPVAFIAFTGEQAQELADTLTMKAWELRGITSEVAKKARDLREKMREL